MKIVIDADGCPVIDITVKISKDKNIPCVIVCDTSHYFSINGVETITVSKGTDSADFKIVNMINKNDIVITQDYGLAAMCLSREAIVLNQNGLIYTKDNIDSLLAKRHVAKKIRLSGGRLKGPSKRSEVQNVTFETVLVNIINTLL